MSYHDDDEHRRAQEESDRCRSCREREHREYHEKQHDARVKEADERRFQKEMRGREPSFHIGGGGEQLV